MTTLDQRRILLGIGGGIAAYKAPELVRRLRDAGADVHVIMTAAAARFVSPLALEVVSTHPVGTSLWDTDGDSGIVHTDIGQEADLIILAPATANLIARIRHGLADDLLTTAVMACTTPVIVCPSMNTDMLANPLVQANIEALEGLDRYQIVTPDVGDLACGVIGSGRLPDPPEIIAAAAARLSRGPLTGVRVTITAGPTREAIDPVRFISNRSTGTMGIALADAFAAGGASVTLIAGPIQHATPAGVRRRVDVVTAAEMAHAVDDQWPVTDVLVMAAAVADYRPAAVATEKLKKTAGGLEGLTLERTTDILQSVTSRRDRDERVLVGFAAETSDVEAHARDKLARKGLDFIVGNDVSGREVGFGIGDNAGVLISRDGQATALPRAAKPAFARHIVELLTPPLAARFLSR